MVYFDSAYIAKFYLSEPDSDRVRALAERQGKVCCSTIGRVETAQVFHRKLREGQATRAQCGALFDQFETDCESGLWTWLPLTHDLVAMVARRFRDFSSSVVLEADEMILYAAPARWRLGQILGGSEGDARMAEAAAAMTDRGVADCARFADAFAPAVGS